MDSEDKLEKYYIFKIMEESENQNALSNDKPFSVNRLDFPTHHQYIVPNL